MQDIWIGSIYKHGLIEGPTLYEFDEERNLFINSKGTMKEMRLPAVQGERRENNVVYFASESKHDVNLWLAGALALKFLVHEWSKDE